MNPSKIGNTKRIIDFQRILLIAVCVFCGICIILPQLIHRYPDLLDVAETISYKQENVITNIRQSFVEQDRFRPLYSVIRVILAKIFGYSSRYYFLSHGVLIGLTIYAITGVVRPGRWFVMAPIAFLLFLSPYAVDAYWRLGTAEPVLGFLLITSYVLFVKKKYPWLVVFLCLGALSKETFVVYFPAFLYGLWSVGNKKVTALVGVIFIISILLLLPRGFLALFGGQSYPSMITLHPGNISGILDVISKYSVIIYPLLFLIFFMGFLLVKFRQGNNVEIRMIFILLAGSLLPVITINNIQFYYLLPTLIIINVLCISTAGRLLNIHKPRWSISVYVAMLFCSLLLIGYTVERAIFWFNDYSGDSVLISWLVTDSRKYSTVSLGGRSEYQDAIAFMLNDPALYDNYIQKEEYNCTEQPDGSSVACSVKDATTTQLTAKITQTVTGRQSSDLCTVNVLLNKQICKWRIDIVP